MEQNELCANCADRDVCQAPCKGVEEILHEDNRIMERYNGDQIVSYPLHKEVRFSEMQAMEGTKQKMVEDFSADEAIPWASGDFRLRKTVAFIERFFNKTPCKELAERFDVKENTIVCMYRDAMEQVERIIDVLDARKEGIKALKPGKFTED